MYGPINIYSDSVTLLQKAGSGFVYGMGMLWIRILTFVQLYIYRIVERKLEIPFILFMILQDLTHTSFKDIILF